MCSSAHMAAAAVRLRQAFLALEFSPEAGFMVGHGRHGSVGILQIHESNINFWQDMLLGSLSSTLSGPKRNHQGGRGLACQELGC